MKSNTCLIEISLQEEEWNKTEAIFQELMAIFQNDDVNIQIQKVQKNPKFDFKKEI